MAEKQREVLLAVKDLHVWFELRRFGFGHAGYVKAVDGVSFELKEKETVAVVGESGCGKSSLMKTILGLNVPTSGEVIFDDENFSNLKGNALHHYRFKIGYVQQDREEMDVLFTLLAERYDLSDRPASSVTMSAT